MPRSKTQQVVAYGLRLALQTSQLPCQPARPGPSALLDPLARWTRRVSKKRVSNTKVQSGLLRGFVLLRGNPKPYTLNPQPKEDLGLSFCLGAPRGLGSRDSVAWDASVR